MYKLAYPHRHVQRKILAIGHCFQRYLENVEVGILAGEKSMEAVLFLVINLTFKKKVNLLQNVSVTIDGKWTCMPATKL